MDPQMLQQMMAQMGGQGGDAPPGYQQPGMPPVPIPAPAPPPTMPPGGPGPVQPPLAGMMGQNPMALMKLLMLLEAMGKMPKGQA